MSDLEKIAGCRCDYSKKYYREVDVIKKLQEMQDKIDNVSLELNTSEILRKNLLKTVDYYESEIDKLKFKIFELTYAENCRQ